MIQTYDPRWPTVFEQEKALINRVLEDRVLAVEHIGSTAVVGLAAKPIVDIMAGLVALDDDPRTIARLQAIDYQFIPWDEMPEDRFFKKRVQGVEVVHLHLTEYQSPFWQAHLLFRDFLRTYPEQASAYEELKRQLAPQFGQGYLYALAKTEFIQSALGQARKASAVSEEHPDVTLNLRRKEVSH